MPAPLENPDEMRVVSVKVSLPLWERIAAEAHRRSVETGRHVSATAVVRGAVASGLGFDPVAANAPKPRKVTLHRVETPGARVRIRSRATGCNSAKAGG